VLARHLAVVILIAATILLVLAMYDVPITGLLATSAVGSAIIGLALQDVLGNVIAGVALQAEHPFKVGDWVNLGEHMGRVIEMNWRATRILTLDGHHVVLPNSTVARGEIKNYHQPKPVEARHLIVGVEYGVPPAKVKSVLLEAALGAEGVVSRPEPKIWLIKYGDFSITYEIKFWLERFADHRDIEDAVMTRVWYLLKRNQIVIPFPIRNIFHHRDVRPFRKDVLEPGVEAIYCILRGVPILRPLAKDDLHALAGRLGVSIYTAGEVLVRQGQPGDSFLIIDSGRVAVRVGDSQVAVLRAGDYFGEMSLLTGQPRSATVVAMEDTRVMVIDRECFESVLKANPEIAEKLSEELERIEAENLARLQEQGVVDPKAEPTSAHSLLGRLKRLFGLG
jgi:CRP-like cAMP-binding protein